MKRIHVLLLIAALLPLALVKQAHAGPTSPAILTSNTSEALAAAAPTTVTQGLDLTGVSGWRVTVCANSGQTLGAGGSLQGYEWSTVLSVWARAPGLDVAVTAAGSRCQAFKDSGATVGRGRIFFAATNVPVSGGTTVNVILEGSQL